MEGCPARHFKFKIYTYKIRQMIYCKSALLTFLNINFLLFTKYISGVFTFEMLYITFLKSIIFCSLVASRPLQTEQINKSQHLSRRARPYSVVPVDGSADRTSSTPIKTTVVTRVETAITTKVVTVPDAPVTQTVFLTISAKPNEPDTYQPNTDTNMNSFPLLVQEQSTPNTTIDRIALHSPSETVNKMPSSPSPTSAPAATNVYRDEERSGQTDETYLYTYRWSNLTSSTHEGSVPTMNDHRTTISSY